MAAKTVGTSAVSLFTASGGNTNLGETLIFQNNHASNKLYYLVLRPDGKEHADTSVTEVTSSNGIEMDPGEVTTLDLRKGDEVRVIADGASTDVRYTALRGA